jgi:hypothetical protein
MNRRAVLASMLNRNRELGLITTAPAVLNAIATSFAADFQRGKQWT